MKKVMAAMLVAALSLSIGISSVEAKRLGGGGSIGKQSNNVSRQSASPSPSQSQAAPAKPANQAAPASATPPKPSSPWKGILGGALLGLGLGALLSHLGIGGALASMISSALMIGLLILAVVFIYRMFKSKSGGNAAAPAYAGAASNNVAGFNIPEIGSRVEPSSQPAAFQGLSSASGTTSGNAPWGIPADFDTAGFLRHAKTNFIRLQAAWDKADINDIREFTTPEMYAEVKMQIQERGASPNNTDVVSINAEMLGIETIGNEYMASVRFDGMIKDSANTPAEPFAEVWNLAKPVNGQGGWLLAGIQQVQ